jgi:hypothetical protein
VSTPSLASSVHLPNVQVSCGIMDERRAMRQPDKASGAKLRRHWKFVRFKIQQPRLLLNIDASIRQRPPQASGSEGPEDRSPIGTGFHEEADPCREQGDSPAGSDFDEFLVSRLPCRTSGPKHTASEPDPYTRLVQVKDRERSRGAVVTMCPPDPHPTDKAENPYRAVGYCSSTVQSPR